MRRLVVVALMLAACGGAGGGEVTTTMPGTTTTVIETTTTTTVAQTTTTEAPLDVFGAVQDFMISAIEAEVRAFVDDRLASAGVPSASVTYTVDVDLDQDPVAGFSVVTQDDADALNEHASNIGLLDDAAIYQLVGGGDVPQLSGDETYASLSLPEVFLTWTEILTDLGDLMVEMGLPSSTVARMEQTRALDGTQTAEGDGITASWTYHPDDGLSIILERS